MRLRSFSPNQLIVVREESGKGLVAASADLQSPNLEHDIGNYVYNIRAIKCLIAVQGSMGQGLIIQEPLNLSVKEQSMRFILPL